jgi:hypothetical protein
MNLDALRAVVGEQGCVYCDGSNTTSRVVETEHGPGIEGVCFDCERAWQFIANTEDEGVSIRRIA